MEPMQGYESEDSCFDELQGFRSLSKIKTPSPLLVRRPTNPTFYSLLKECDSDDGDPILSEAPAIHLGKRRRHLRENSNFSFSSVSSVTSTDTLSSPDDLTYQLGQVCIGANSSSTDCNDSLCSELSSLSSESAEQFYIPKPLRSGRVKKQAAVTRN